MRRLPDDGKGGLSAYIDRDKQYPDIPHEVESEGTLEELTEEIPEELEKEEVDEVLLDMDETLIAGARTSAFYFAINHFLNVYHQGGTPEQDQSPAFSWS